MDSFIPLNPCFRGVIRAERGGACLMEHISGYANLPNEIPNTRTTRFASASAGKVFVAVGILQLIDRGILTLDTPLGSLLDELHQIDPTVTLRQLLNHTSGVPDYFDETVMSEYWELWTDFPNYRIRRNNDLFPLFWDRPMLYSPGERFQYNNSGFVLLAAIIEKMTGIAFDRYLGENVFVPSGMEDTGYFELDRLPARCADHYIYCEATGDYRTNIFSVDAKGTGAGGAYITVPDIFRFWSALLGGKLISPTMLREMTSVQSTDGQKGEESQYGLGMWIFERPGRANLCSFQGCDPGVSFISEYDPETNTVSVLVSNYGDNVWEEMRQLRKVLYP